MRTSLLLPLVVLCTVLYIPLTLAENIIVYNEIPLNYPWTGYMEDHNGNSLGIDTTWATGSENGTYCANVTYSRQIEQWTGLYIQSLENSWICGPGIGLNLAGAKKLIFYAKGKDGDENVRFGYGYDQPCPGSTFRDSAFASRIEKLTNYWKRYEFDLAGKDLSHINGLFMFSADKFNNPNSITFYLDNITYLR